MVIRIIALFNEVTQLVSISHGLISDLLSIEVPAGIIPVKYLVNVVCLKFVQTLSERIRLGVVNVDLMHDLIDNLVSNLLKVYLVKVKECLRSQLDRIADASEHLLEHLVQVGNRLLKGAFSLIFQFL